MEAKSATALAIIVPFLVVLVLPACGGTGRGGDTEPDSEKIEDAEAREVRAAADIPADHSADTSTTTDTPPPFDLQTEDVAMDLAPVDLAEVSPELTGTPDAQMEVEVSPDIAPPGPGEPWKFVVVLSSPVVGKHFGEFGDSVSVWCLPVDGEGKPLPDPGDVVVSTDAPDAIVDGAEHAFPQRGEYVVSCQSESLGIVGDTTLSVTTGALNDQYVFVARRLGELHLHLGHLLKALVGEDIPAVATSAQQLTNLASECLPSGMADLALLVPLPNGWPSVEELGAMGAEPQPDDEQFALVLEQITQQLAVLVAVMKDMETDFSQENAMVLEAEVDNLFQLAQQLSLLNPSELAVMANRDKLAALMGPAVDALTRQTALTMAAAADSSRWTLTEIMVTVAIKGIMAKLPSVEWVLIQSAKTMTQMIMMMELFEALSEQGGSGFAPVVYTIYGPGAMSVNPGLKWKIDGGGFSYTPEHNMVIFIPPEVFKAAAELIWDIVSLFTSLWSLYDFEWGNYLDWPDYEQFFELAGLAVDFGFNLNSVVNGLHPGGCTGNYNLYPYDVTGEADAQLVWFNEFPTKVNCSFVPQNGILIPVNLYGGIGEAVQVMTGKEPPGACTCE